MRDYVYPPVIRVALTLFRVLGFRFDMRGIENLPADGGAVLASNHVSYFDFMFVGLTGFRRGKRLVRFMAKDAVFRHRVSGPLMRGMHHIPVDRAAGAAAYKHAVAALQRGEIVGVFPESTISRSFVPRPLKSGAARMALEAGVPLIPVVVWGGQRVWTVGRRPKLRRRIPVSIWVDEPLPAVAGESPAELTARLAVRLRELVDAVLAEYPVDRGDAELWWLPAHVGGIAPTPEEAAAAERTSGTGRKSA
ncbi:MAG TPA: lysophospholipid acyltransferase family protein, partial [Mycobacteriales bacterium]|nr:lysophospholipid acyltransferase family protein [Mycobacteriales bacterium]